MNLNFLTYATSCDLINRVVLGKKVKQSHYRLGHALRFPGGWGSQISRQSAHEGGKDVSPSHRPPLPQETLLVLISVIGWVNPRAIVRPEVLCQWKFLMAPSGTYIAVKPKIYKRRICCHRISSTLSSRRAQPTFLIVLCIFSTHFFTVMSHTSQITLLGQIKETKFHSVRDFRVSAAK